jgi:hypothetical protein
LTLGVQAILTLEQRWFDDYLLGVRGRAAQHLLAGKGGSDLGEIFDFFDGVGVLFRRGVLDPEMTWGFFFQPFITFWTKGQNYVRIERAKNHTIWETTGELATALQHFEADRRNRPFGEALPTEEEMATILREEKEFLDEL